ncbi:MAG: hypothetical protein ACOX9E_03775 [Lentisphaeria bacterium]|jgi:hypothetical protein
MVSIARQRETANDQSLTACDRLPTFLCAVRVKMPLGTYVMRLDGYTIAL